MQGIRSSGTGLIAFAVTALLATPTQAATVKEVFEKYKLFGTFSYDCTKSADKRNFYFVDRAMDADHVQRDRMSGPTTRDFAFIIDKVEELKPNEIRVSGKHAEDGTMIVSTWRIDSNRMLTWESSENGKPIIREAVVLSNQGKVPYLNRCGD
jgi:hypothetical protein